MRIATALLLLTLPAYAQDQQVGARTKAMGGSYTAFEDDPVSVWLNPAGIATQLDGMTLAYQAYTVYQPIGNDTSAGSGAPNHVPGKFGWTDPALIPSFIGTTFAVGTPDQPQALGFCFATPFRMSFPFTTGYAPGSGGDPNELDSLLDQSFYRFRAAYARDFKFKAAGEAGFFTHLSAGIGGDVGVTSWNWNQLGGMTLGYNDMGFGGGAGILLGLYDNTENLRINLGSAWQSKIKYEFGLGRLVAPLFDWPNQVQVGVTAYLLQGMPLRITADAQWIEWHSAVEPSELAGMDSFRNTLNLSMGMEYRVKASERLTLYPRAGVRRYQAPWSSSEKSELPAIGETVLYISTKDSDFIVGSFGLGVGWSTPEGKARSFDLGFDIGADAPGFGASYNMEF